MEADHSGQFVPTQNASHNNIPFEHEVASASAVEREVWEGCRSTCNEETPTYWVGGFVPKQNLLQEEEPVLRLSESRWAFVRHVALSRPGRVEQAP